MVALAFVLLLLLAIWLAVRLGGVRRRDRRPGGGDAIVGNSDMGSTSFSGDGGDFGGGGGGD